MVNCNLVDSIKEVENCKGLLFFDYWIIIVTAIPFTTDFSC